VCRSALVALIALLVSPCLAGCDDCGRRLYFFIALRDDQGTAVAAAAAEVVCLDAFDGSRLVAYAVSDEGGEAIAAVHALNRRCPADEVAHASYFERCDITIRAEGFADETRRFSGAELDVLPATGRAGNAGDGVVVEITLVAKPPV